MMSNLRSEASPLCELLNELKKIEDTPELLERLTNGLSAISDCSLSDITSSRNKIEMAKNWIEENIIK